MDAVEPTQAAMVSDTPGHARGRSRRLRAGVLHLGAALGWEPRAVRAFGEAVTRCPWPRCREPEFAHMLRAYAAMVDRVLARQSAASRPGPHGVDEAGDADCS